MSLTDLASLGSFVSGLAMVASSSTWRCKFDIAFEVFRGKPWRIFTAQRESAYSMTRRTRTCCFAVGMAQVTSMMLRY
jgi:hypothetical protein